MAIWSQPIYIVFRIDTQVNFYLVFGYLYQHNFDKKAVVGWLRIGKNGVWLQTVKTDSVTMMLIHLHQESQNSKLDMMAYIIR